MTEMRDWQHARAMWIRVLEQNTGESLDTWNERVRQEGSTNEPALRAWLTRQGIIGYAQNLLVMERFGYPGFVTTPANELVDNQYADRPHLRPILEAILNAVQEFGGVIIQSRKTYVSLVTPRRTFARVQPTTKTRVDLGLRLSGLNPGGRLQPCTIQETMRGQVGLSSVEQVDDEVQGWLRKAYEENA